MADWQLQLQAKPCNEAAPQVVKTCPLGLELIIGRQLAMQINWELSRQASILAHKLRPTSVWTQLVNDTPRALSLACSGGQWGLLLVANALFVCEFVGKNNYS